jgi:hypothetical protein
MSVVRCKLRDSGEHGSITGLMEKNYEQIYTVVVDNPLDNADVVLFAPGLPQLGDSYLGGDACMYSHDPKRIDALVWEVVCKFSNHESSGGGTGKHGKPGQQGQNQLPLDRPWKRSLTFTQVDRVRWHDLDNKSAQYPNGERIQGGIPIPETIAIYTVTRNEEYQDCSGLLQYSGATNSTEFLGWAVGTVRMAIRSEEQYESEVSFLTTTYEMSFCDLGWDLEELNVGTWYLDDSGKEVVPKDSNGVATGAMVRLDANGHKLEISDNPTYTKFRNHRRADFNDLDLM